MLEQSHEVGEMTFKSLVFKIVCIFFLVGNNKDGKVKAIFQEVNNSWKLPEKGKRGMRMK